jgi:hypothetical protein
MRVMSSTPLSLSTRMITTENRIVSQSTTCTATMPAAIAAASQPPLDPLDEHHGRDDRAGSGEQRGAERDERDVDVLGLSRFVAAAGQQLERDQEQQQAAGALQRGSEMCR